MGTATTPALTIISTMHQELEIEMLVDDRNGFDNPLLRPLLSRMINVTLEDGLRSVTRRLLNYGEVSSCD